jgi:hypothetical protein
MRHLHGRGLVLLSVVRMDRTRTFDASPHP